MKKRITSLFLAILLVISCLPSVVAADAYGNLEFAVARNDQIGSDGKTIEYANGYKLSVTYDDIGENRISTLNDHTELRDIPDGTAVTFTLSIPAGETSVPDLMLSGARESFTDNTFTRNLNFSQNNVICVELDFGNNLGPSGPNNPPDIDDGDVCFIISESDTDVVQYSIDGAAWTSVMNNDVVKADALSGATIIYIKAVPGEGRKLDDYIDNDISVNQYRIEGTPTALNFANDVASFEYNSNAQIEVVVRFMDDQPGPGIGDNHVVKIQINNNDGADGSVQCKFDTEQGFTTYTVADYDGSGNIKLEIPDSASTITFKAVPNSDYAVQDCTILYDDQDIDETKAYMNGVKGDGYEYTLPDDDKMIVFRVDFGNELITWHTVSWDGGNVKVENGQVKAYAVHVGDKTYDENITVADETNKLYPLADIAGLDIQTHNVSFSDTDLFISDMNNEDISIDFRFIPDYGYQVTDIIATEGSVIDQFNPGMEISTFNFEYIPGTNVHFIVKFTSTNDIINNEGNIVSNVSIADGENAISSGNLKMNIADVAPENISDALKDEVGENDAQYLSMTLSQVVSKGGSNGNWENPLTELDGDIDISLTVSDLDPNGEYYIIREHINDSGNAVYDEIPTDYDSATSAVSFATDKFSTYALVKKVPTPTTSPEPSGEPTPTNEPTPTSIPSPEPSGDPTPTTNPEPSGEPAPTNEPTPTQAPELNVGDFIDRCYEVTLGRDADEAGLNYWVDGLNNGELCGAQAVYGFIFSSEYINKNRTNEEFVNDMYAMYFGREADEAGFNYWVEQLNNETATREDIMAGFANSEEFFNLCSKYGVVCGAYLTGVPNDQQGGINSFVARLYKVCLNRLPDQGGQAGWVMKLMNGEVTGSTCAYGFVFSEEFTNLNLDNTDFVKYMYNAFFGREADEAGLAYWVDMLNAGTATREDVFAGFTGSAEFINLCASYGIIA